MPKLSQLAESMSPPKPEDHDKVVKRYMATRDAFDNQLKKVEFGHLDHKHPLRIKTVSYTHLTLPTTTLCRSRWSPYH